MAKNFWKCFNYNNFNKMHCNMCDKYYKNKLKKNEGDEDEVGDLKTY
jgi:hypothetical protein